MSHEPHPATLGGAAWGLVLIFTLIHGRACRFRMHRPASNAVNHFLNGRFL